MTQTNQPIKLVCLDLGGVMMRICGNWAEACALAQVPLPAAGLPPEEITRAIGPIVRAHECGKIDQPAFLRQAAAAVGLSPEQVLGVSVAWIREPYPGAVDLIERLSRVPGLRTACLSNTNPAHWRAMTTPGEHFLSLDRLTWRFASFEIGCMKPDAGIYEHVERIAAGEGIAPSSIAYFDDSAAYIAAAAARGWRAVQIDPAGDPPRQIAEALHAEGINIRAA